MIDQAFATEAPSSRVTSSKVFVLDTNVILHDAGCIHNFEENDIAIPMTVLEELDRFKKGNDDIHFQARQFLRTLDNLTGDVLSKDGANLGQGLGSIRVILGGPQHEMLKGILTHDVPDHRILSAAIRVRDEADQQDRPVILITKDTNLRVKAKAFGLVAQDYSNDKVESFDKLYTGKRLIEGVETNLVDQFYTGHGRVNAQEYRLPIEAPLANENFIIRNGSKSVLATYSQHDNCYRRVEKNTTYGITPRNAEQAFAIQALMNDDIKLVTLAGKAGSGKTLVALAAALEQRQNYRQILLARPIVPLSNRDIGFLPGDVSAKLDPYMQPLFDNLTVIKHENKQAGTGDKIQEMLETKKLEITPLAYIRGRSLQRIFFIVDEAQNLTPHEIKTIITRAGEGTKVIFTGDIYQIDHPYLDALSNGFSYVINRMVGQPIYAHVTLEKGERSELAELASNLL